MKICFIGDAGHVNLLSWVKYLADKQGHEIHILTFNRPCEQINGITVHVLCPFFKNTKARYFFNLSQVKKKIYDIKPDILIGYRINSYGFMAVMSGFHPVVVVAQGSDIFYPVNSKIQNYFIRYVLKKADLIQAWAVHMGDKLLEYGTNKDKMMILPKGVDTNVFKPADKQHIDNSFTMISTRQLRKTYGHECVLNALLTASEQIPNLKYLICGDGEYREELELLARKSGIEKFVKFIGTVKHEALPSYLGSADIYVSMQSSDGVSSSLLEAMACGVFPIVTDIEANRLWIKDGINGFLVPVNDHLSLAKKIILASENHKLRQEAKVKNVNLVSEKGSMSHNMDRMEEAYHKLINEIKDGKIKVLLLLYSAESAGAEKIALSIAKYINEERYKPVICAFRGGRLLKEFLALNVPVYILNKKKGVDLSIILKLLRIMRAEKIKIIHSHNFSPNFWGRVVGIIARIPVIISAEHTVATVKTRLQKTIDYILSKVTDKIIVVSNSVRDSHIQKEGIISEKFITIYNGIEPWVNSNKTISNYRLQLMDELCISPDNYIITTVGRLEPPKGYEHLLKAIPSVQEIYPKAYFLIVGDGYLKADLEILAGKLGIMEKVFFFGYRSNARDILAVSDMCVIPSVREGFSVTLLEAMSVGKPIVATDVGGNAEAIIDGESGIIVPPADPFALANGIITVLKDKKTAEEMGVKAKNRFNELFTLEKMIDKTERLYESLSYKMS